MSRPARRKLRHAETLHAEIDQLEASNVEPIEDITELTKAVAGLDVAVAKAAKLRQEEKAKNTDTISDSQEWWRRRHARGHRG